MTKIIEYEIKTGAENMQIDSDLLDLAIQTEEKRPIFRLYGWSPACVSLGRNQNDDFLDKNFLKSMNIDIVRRLTGGRALLHDKELTYSYIIPISSLKDGQSVVGSYKEISQILIDGFEKLGIKLDFGEKKHKKSDGKHLDYCMSISTGADLCYEGKKLIGSAQFRKQGYILQHGSILFDYDSDLTEKIFNENPALSNKERGELHEKKAEEKNLVCLKYINPDLSIGDVKLSLLKSLTS